MVDFQSRDSRRGTSEEVAESEDESEASTDESDGETGDGESAAESIEYETASGDAVFSYAVVTVSADGSLADDPAGKTVVDAIEGAGDGVATRELLRPSYDGIQSSLDALVGREDVDALVTVGGTGVEPDDLTVDAASDLFDRELAGFGELFRILAHDREGSAVIRTRTTAGIVDAVPVFCLPGDGDAARLGVEQIVIDEAPTVAALAESADSSDADESSIL